MRQLLLLRHAEAEPIRAGLTDAQRSLTAHGRHQALQAAERLKGLGPLPDALLISPATRTCQTAQIVAEQLTLRCEPRCEPALYADAVDALLAALRSCPEVTHCLLVVGHNPGLSALGQHLAGGRSLELPTAGLCRIDFEAAGWRQLSAEAVRSVSIC